MSKIIGEPRTTTKILHEYTQLSPLMLSSIKTGGYRLRHVRVRDVLRLSRSYLVARLQLLEDFVEEPKPGQFVMIWIPGVDYIPMSIADYSGSEILIFFKIRGEGTRVLANSKGRILGVVGPLGKPIDIDDKSRDLLLAGGTGLAPLIRLAKELNSLGLLEGVVWGTRSSIDVGGVPRLFKEITGSELTICTEDCSMGLCGKVTDIAYKLIPSLRGMPIEIVAAGPNRMLVSIASIGLRYDKNPVLIVESTVKCGLGLCGECILGETGLRLCRDGPAFKASMILDYLNSISNTLTR